MIPKNKTIAILHPGVDKKGWAVNMMILLANLLKKRWNKVEFYTLLYDKTLFWREISFNISVSTKVKIAYKIRKCDYIFVWNSPMQFVAGLSKILFCSQAKILWWHHHYPWYYEKHTNLFIFFKRCLEKFFIQFIDVFIANSIFIQNALKEIYGVNSEVLYPVLDSYFLGYIPRKKNFNQYTIISYGRRVQGKNLGQIFQTYKEIKKKIPKLELLLWWVWNELEFYKKQYQYDTDIKILWILDNKDIIDNLEKANVFLFPSKIDSFGLSPLEALSIWIPVVWFSWRWITQLVQNNKNGFLVDSQKEFTNKTFDILINKSLNKDLSRSSINVREQYSHKKFIQDLEKIFLEK